MYHSTLFGQVLDFMGNGLFLGKAALGYFTEDENLTLHIKVDGVCIVEPVP